MFVQLTLSLALLALALVLHVWARSAPVVAVAQHAAQPAWLVALAHAVSALSAVIGMFGLGLVLIDVLGRMRAPSAAPVTRTQITPAARMAYRPERRQAILRQRPLDADDAAHGGAP